MLIDKIVVWSDEVSYSKGKEFDVYNIISSMGDKLFIKSLFKAVVNKKAHTAIG